MLDLLPTPPASSFAHGQRARAVDALRDHTLPTRKTEAWKYTPVAKRLGDARWTLAKASSVSEALPRVGELPRLVFVNGRYSSELSDPLPQDLSVRRLDDPEIASTVTEHCGRLISLSEPFVALNTAYTQEGLAVILAPNTVHPGLHLVHLSTASEGERHLCAPRVLVIAERSSQITLVEEHLTHGAGQTLSAAITEIAVGTNAQVDHLQLFNQGPRALHLGHLAVEVAQDGRFNHQHLSLGGALTRAQTDLSFVGRGAEANLRGLFATADSQVHDHHLTVRHTASNCTSHQLYKGVIADQGRGVFSGQVQVAPGVTKSLITQQNPNLLLNRRARIFTRPQLIIDNDDVTASHGATVGQLDPEALFYLQARGLSMPEARRVLTSAFANEIIDELPFPELRERVRAAVVARLSEAKA